MTVPSRALLVKYVAAVLALIGLSVVIMAGVVPAGAAPAAEERPAVARLISAAVGISPPLARLEAGLQMVPRGSVLTAEGRLRPVADLGSWARSRGYRRVSPELGDALAEGSAQTPRPAPGPGATSGATAPA